MALTEQSVIDKIEVLETGHIQVRTSNRVIKDGKIIAEEFHRTTLEPNSDLSGQDAKVAAVAAAAWL